MSKKNTNTPDLERLKADIAAAKEAGFALAPPIFALGTRVNSMGVDNFTRSRAKFEAKPKAEKGLRDFAEAVKSEGRVSKVVDVSDITMLDDGTITGPKAASSVALNRNTLKAILYRTSFPKPGAAGTYLAEISTARRAKEFNAIINEHAGENEAQLRFRKNPLNNEIELFHVVSPSYTPYDPDLAAEDILASGVVTGDTRLDLTYDGYRYDIALMAHSNIKPETACAGEIFKAVMGLRSADDSSSALNPYSGAFRNLCLNLIILSIDEISFGSRRHVGDESKLTAFIKDMMSLAAKSIEYFVEKWDEARHTDFAKLMAKPIKLGKVRADEIEARDIFRSLVGSGRVRVPGVRKPEAEDLLIRSFNKEPENNLAGVSNAVTRLAHEGEWSNLWTTTEMEETGASLLTSLLAKPLSWVDRPAEAS